MTRMPSPTDRVYFLDNLRMFTVLAVIVLHVGVAYATLVPWYYVMDSQKNAVFDFLLLVADGFTMPTLFFIAGYFALPSLRKYGPTGFCIAKIKRLGLPLVVITFLFCPIISYLASRNRGGSLSYFEYWLRLLPTALNWCLGVSHSSEDVLQHLDQFMPYHLWFLGLLLFFDGLLLVGYALVGRRLSGAHRTSGRGAGFGLFLILALVVGLAEAFAQVAITDIAWARLGPLVVFQPARLPLYLGFFGLGLFATAKGWFTTVRLPGQTWIWGVLAVVSFALMMGTITLNMAPGGPKPLWIPFAHGLARTFFCLAVVGVLIAFGQRYWNRPGGVSASLAASSYDIYLAHFPLVLVLQYLLLGLAVSAVSKFGIIFLTVTCLCWGASRFSKSRRRLWVPAGTLAAFGTCLLAWG
jgi:glucans biosynthesis protein C